MGRPLPQPPSGCAFIRADETVLTTISGKSYIVSQSEPKPRPVPTPLSRCSYCGLWSVWKSRCPSCGGPMIP